MGSSADVHSYLAHKKVLDFDFDLVNWYLDTINQQLIYQSGTEAAASEYTEDSDQSDDLPCIWEGINGETCNANLVNRSADLCEWVSSWLRQTCEADTCLKWPVISLAGVQILQGTIVALQRNMSIPKDFMHIVPKPIVVIVWINGQPAHTLLDSGSLGDFVSTSIADQLKLLKVELLKPLALQLAVHSS